MNLISRFKFEKVVVTGAFLLQKRIKELLEFNTFIPRKATMSSTLLIRERCQGYRCEMGIAILAWRINDAYSPFKYVNLGLDLGSGYTAVRDSNRNTGFIPTSSIEIHSWYHSFQLHP